LRTPFPPAARRTRVRCSGVDVDLTREGWCHVQVRLEWVGGQAFTGEATGNSTPEGRMNAGALAALDALAEVSAHALELELRGTKLVRAFDSLLVIVAVRARLDDRRFDLIGSTVTPEDNLARGAVFSILDATNRVIEAFAVPEPQRTPPPDPNPHTT